MKNIVITGVSTGIGYHTAQLFCEKGFRVFGSVRKESDAQKLKAALGDNFEPMIFDVVDNKAILEAAQMVKKAINTEGVSLLINNAGIAVSGPLQHLNTDELIHQFNVNVIGVQRVTQAFLPLLGATFNKNISKGKIINISSVSAIITPPFLGPYCASKAALNSLTDALRRELSLFGIPVVLIQPGPIKTPIWDKARAETNMYEGTEYEKIFKNAQKSIDESEKQAIDTPVVAELVFKIYNTSNPKTRYTIIKNKPIIKLVSWLPPKWVDFLLKKRLSN
jgi:short-subunit dehydrogenase